MTRPLVVVLVAVLSFPLLLAAESLPLSDERTVAVSPWPIQQIAVALDGAMVLVVWKAADAFYAIRADGEGVPLDQAPILLPFRGVYPRVATDGDGFVVVGRRPVGGIDALWIGRDGSIRGPSTFAPDAAGFDLTNSGSDALVVANFSDDPFGRNLQIFRLSRDATVTHVLDVAGLAPVASVSAAFGDGRGLIVWTEVAVICRDSHYGPDCNLVYPVHHAVVDLESGILRTFGRWEDYSIDRPLVVALHGDFLAIWTKFNSSYTLFDWHAAVIQPDGTVVPDPIPFWYQTWIGGPTLLAGSRVLVVLYNRDTYVLVADLAWLDVREDLRIEPSAPYEIARRVGLLALAGTGDGSAAIVYTKTVEGNPNSIFIRFAGEREPARPRAVRR